jgi:hypothetical protein
MRTIKRITAHIFTQSQLQKSVIYDTQLQTILQSNNNKNSMVLAQKQT